MIVFLMAACTPPVTPESFQISDAETGVEILEQDAGWYGLKLVLSSLVANPLNQDERGPSVNTSYLIAELSRDGVEITWNETLCAISATEVFGTLSEFPSAFVDTMPVRQRSLVLEELAAGAAVHGGPFVDVNGAQLDEPTSDPLPEEGDDPRVVDQDLDGDPGITIQVTHSIVGTGNIYAAQRGANHFDGEMISADRIEGYVDAESEQVVLGASEAWLTLSTPDPIPAPEPTHSYFILQRMDTAEPDCSTLLSSRSVLFNEG